jgi:fatty acid desaturase
MLHYIWYGAIMFYFMNVWQSILFIVVTQTATGLLLAMAFSLNHNGMAVLDSGSQAKVDFPNLQAMTGRDVSGGGLVSWFMGGLDLQIEHHLFPRIPRHKLPQARNQIRGFCEKNQIPYHQTGFWAGTRELLTRLHKVSTAV